MVGWFKEPLDLPLVWLAGLPVPGLRVAILMGDLEVLVAAASSKGLQRLVWEDAAGRVPR